MAHGHLVIACSGVAGLAALPWEFPALAGAVVFALGIMSTLDSSALARLRTWHIDPWRSVAGTALIGAGQCCLGWAVGTGIRVLAG